jgi:hypothetical protein
VLFKGNGFYTRLLGPMDRIFLAVICAGIILLVIALGLVSPGTNSPGSPATFGRVLPR